MNIAIFVQQLEYMGGIERVTLEQTRIFSHYGANVQLFLNQDVVLMRERITCPIVVLPVKSNLRSTKLERELAEFSPDFMIFHGVSHVDALDDLLVCKKLRIPSVCVIHFPFISNIMLAEGEYNSWKEFKINGASCTAFATVCQLDACFWNALGKSAYHVQNPFVQLSAKSQMVKRQGKINEPINLIWVGRLCEQKQPELALQAFAIALKKNVNIRLTMIGGDEKAIRKLYKFARKLNISDRVEFISECSDISTYWCNADIHLLTSLCESFCLVWAEAKAAGIPTVMFDLPYLELADDARGYIAVGMKDVEALSDVICELATNHEKRLAMGKDARDSLESFNDDAVWQSWMKLYDGIKTGESGVVADRRLKMVVEQLYIAICHDKESHRWPEVMVRNLERLLHIPMRPIANAIKRIVQALKRLR